MELRDATVADLDLLSELAYASKAYWGYDDAFMRACRAELTVGAEDLARMAVRVADGGVIAGFHGVAPVAPEAAELVWLFVAPDAMGRGVGSALLCDAIDLARLAGARTLHIEADPYAEAFYLHRGARRVGEVPSGSLPGRMLPLLHVDLA